MGARSRNNYGHWSCAYKVVDAFLIQLWLIRDCYKKLASGWISTSSEVVTMSEIFVDEASVPTEFINSSSTGLALNRMGVDHTSALWKSQPDTDITLGEDNSNLYLLNSSQAVIQHSSWIWNKAILSFSANTTHQTELSYFVRFIRH